MNNYNKSGRHSNLSFKNFCKGDVIVQYTHLLSKTHSLFSQILTRQIVGASTAESPEDSTIALSSSESTTRKWKRKMEEVFIEFCDNFKSPKPSPITLPFPLPSSPPINVIPATSLDSELQRVENRVIALTKEMASIPEGEVFDRTYKLFKQ